MTYWMNELQGIDPDKPLFVSLNPPVAPDPALTFGKYLCEHPQYNAAAFAAQKRLPEIQGRRHTWFCGAWTGYGFHEDGLQSGLPVLAATFNGHCRTLDTKELLRAFFALPLVTMKIMAAIHWEALRLWLKGARLVPRKDAALNTGLATGKSNDYTSPALSTRAKDCSRVD